MSRAASRSPIADAAAAAGGRFIVDARDVIEDVDAAACALIGYAPEEVIGLHGSELIPLEAHAATAVSLDRMRRGEIAHRAARVRHKDGRVLAVEVTAQPLSDGRLILRLRPAPPS